MTQVHMAIIREVLPGKEAEFEAAIVRFFQESMSQEGVLGAHLLKPLPDSGSREYGILRSFASDAARDAFYASPQFASWQESVRDLVQDSYQIRPLHGLEAFFRGGGTPPPRWKMAFLTWAGVYPSVLVWSFVLGQLNMGLPPVLLTAGVTGLVVISLAWAIMPLLTKLFRPWLHGTG